MTQKKLSSRERIVRSALKLFAVGGITATTTKEIAEKAGVNEVTLFRQFGSKQGLLLAVLQEPSLLEAMKVALADVAGASEALVAYGSAGMSLLERVPELVRSLIGESGQSPPENRQALGKTLRQANQQTVDYLQSAEVSCPGLSTEEIASLLNALILGHAVIEASSEEHALWQDKADFLRRIDSLFSTQTEEPITDALGPGAIEADLTGPVADLLPETVRSLFQNAKKHSAQAYALTHVLFGAGLRVEECVGLMRSQIFSSKTQHLLTVTGTTPRQVPVNRWIMGNRYGTYLKNPLTQWLKSREDDCPNVFVTASGEPLDVAGIMELWDELAEEITTSLNNLPSPFQARQTWCIELLSKGISPENLSLLSGIRLEDLEPYARRVREKAALEQALSIDQKS
ncbi:MAG: TetR family transcriptional regulator [Cyanobacteria bacterium J06621_3]